MVRRPNPTFKPTATFYFWQLVGPPDPESRPEMWQLREAIYPFFVPGEGEAGIGVAQGGGGLKALHSRPQLGRRLFRSPRHPADLGTGLFSSGVVSSLRSGLGDRSGVQAARAGACPHVRRRPRSGCVCELGYVEREGESVGSPGCLAKACHGR